MTRRHVCVDLANSIINLYIYLYSVVEKQVSLEFLTSDLSFCLGSCVESPILSGDDDDNPRPCNPVLINKENQNTTGKKNTTTKTYLSIPTRYNKACPMNQRRGRPSKKFEILVTSWYCFMAEKNHLIQSGMSKRPDYKGRTLFRIALSERSITSVFLLLARIELGFSRDNVWGFHGVAIDQWWWWFVKCGDTVCLVVFCQTLNVNYHGHGLAIQCTRFLSLWPCNTDRSTRYSKEKPLWQYVCIF